MKTIWITREEVQKGDWILLDDHTVSTVMNVEKRNGYHVRTTNGDYFKVDKDMKIQKILEM